MSVLIDLKVYQLTQTSRKVMTALRGVFNGDTLQTSSAELPPNQSVFTSLTNNSTANTTILITSQPIDVEITVGAVVNVLPQVKNFLILPVALASLRVKNTGTVASNISLIQQ